MKFLNTFEKFDIHSRISNKDDIKRVINFQDMWLDCSTYGETFFTNIINSIIGNDVSFHCTRAHSGDRSHQCGTDIHRGIIEDTKLQFYNVKKNRFIKGVAKYLAPNGVRINVLIKLKSTVQYHVLEEIGRAHV